MAPPTFEAAVEAGRDALGSMAKGDPEPSTALWSRRDDVVLANPLGPPIVGYSLVAAETARVASMFVRGESLPADEITRWASDDLGYVVAIEHAAGRARRQRRARAFGPPGHDGVPPRGRRMAPLPPSR